jgi:REP element-mobilizing transposase RayT
MLYKRNCHRYQVGGYKNHVHITTHISPTINLACLVREIKKTSHEMMRTKKELFQQFHGWQVGYGGMRSTPPGLHSDYATLREQREHLII